MKKVILSVFLVILISCTNLNNPYLPSSLIKPVIPEKVYTWQKMIGGSGNEGSFDLFEKLSIQQTKDRGYIIAGYSGSTDISGVTNHGGADCFIIKLDVTGNIVWKYFYGGIGQDSAISVQQTDDGGYIVGGNSYSADIPNVLNNGSSDFYILKLDSSGNMIWHKMIGGNNQETLYSIHQTGDGGYIAAGYTCSTNIPDSPAKGNLDYYIVKLDHDGNIVWQKIFGGSLEDKCHSVDLTADGGYIVSGQTNSADISGVNNLGNFDIYIIKLDVNGNIVWHNKYGAGDGDWGGSTIKQTRDGGYIVAGDSNSSISGTIFHGFFDYYIIRLDTSGNVVWQKMYGGSGEDRIMISVCQTTDDGFIIGGSSASIDLPGLTNNGSYDFYIIKVDIFGQVMWDKLYGGSSNDGLFSIQQTRDGGYVAAGYSNSFNIPGVVNNGGYDIYIIKLDTFGNF